VRVYILLHILTAWRAVHSVRTSTERLIADNDPALEQPLFKIAQAHLQAEIPVHGATDDRRRKTIPVIERSAQDTK
jgi:hypothetical protein